MIDNQHTEKTSKKEKNKPDDSEGAVTFLDVLGWKGIWQKQDNALSTLFEFIEDIKNKANLITMAYYGNETGSMRAISTTVISVSDTIAIFTPSLGAEDLIRALQIHGKICSFIIPESIKRKIPVRGATSIGRYSTKDSIMIGPAVDEAASWHEAHDFIGVILTPSANFKIKRVEVEGWKKYRPPYKNKGFGETGCVEWNFDAEDKSIEEYFYDMGPHIPEIAAKYSNTLDFLAASKAPSAPKVIPIPKVSPTPKVVASPKVVTSPKVAGSPKVLTAPKVPKV